MPDVLLATDFDGTIAPIVANPEQARIHPLMERFLGHCSSVSGIAVAVISGRDAEDVRRRIGSVRAIVAGSHGLECVGVDGEVLWTTERPAPDLPPSLARQALRAGLRIERKKFSFALHSRGADGAGQDVNRVAAAVTAWADEHNLDVIAGREVVEVRVRGGGKRAALRLIAERLRAPRVMYAGDDITDFPALAFAAAHGRAVFVESDERTTPDIPGLWRVRGIEDLCFAFTRELIDQWPAIAAALAPYSVTAGVSVASDSRRERTTTP
jgi:trehalose-phosphatase